jgi:hypothetical protein
MIICGYVGAPLYISRIRVFHSTECMNVSKIKSILIKISGKQPNSYDDGDLTSLNEFLQQPNISNYLRHCLPKEIIGVSGVRLLPLDAIEAEMSEGAAPGSFIRTYGYVIVATSIGGNAICFHSPSGKVFWADHTSFNSGSIAFKDRTTGEWKYLYEYTPENVAKALVLLSDNIENFLDALLTDRLNARLDALD